MRRRALLATVGAGVTGVAGCAAFGTDSEQSPSDESTGTPTVSSEPTGTPTGPDGVATDLLRFDDAVGETVRERCRRTLDRTVEITGQAPTDDVRVVYVDVESTTDGSALPGDLRRLADTATAESLRPPSDVAVPGRFGSYSSSQRILRLADPAGMPATMFEDVAGMPTLTFENFPSEPFLAHELTHAVQFDATAVAGGADSIDGRVARRGVLEGTADYVWRLYRTRCLDGEYDPCTIRETYPARAELSLWIVPRRFPYANGTLFAAHTIQQNGWDALWAAHRDPPATTAALSFPAADVTAHAEPEPVEPHSSVGGPWERVTYNRVGVVGLYLKLRSVGVVDATAPGSTVPSAVTAETGVERIYRADLLRDWRGDRMTTFVDHDDARFASHWRTVWASEDTARRVADGVAAAYDAGGERDGDSWRLDETVVVTVERSGRAVTFIRAPDADALATIR